MGGIRKLVLDVLKPEDPTIIDLSLSLLEVKGVKTVKINLIEIDKNVENVKVIVIGDDIDCNGVFEVLDELGCALHSIDEVVAGELEE